MRGKILAACLVSSMVFSVGCTPGAGDTQNAAGLVANGVNNRASIGFSQNGNVDSGWYVGKVRAGHTIQVDSANKTVNIRIGYAAIDKTARSQSAVQGPTPVQATSNHVARIAIPVGWRVNLSGMGHVRWGGELGIAKVDNRGNYASSPILGTSLQSATPGQYVVLSSVRGPSRVVFDWISYSNTIHMPVVSYDYA